MTAATDICDASGGIATCALQPQPMVKLPPALGAGDVVRVIAPCGCFDPEMNLQQATLTVCP
jgi:hypothetical protein